MLGKLFFWCPCWLFFAGLVFLLLVAISCKVDEKTPPPTWTPEQLCLIKETRTDRTNENLDRAYKLCYN